MVGGNWEVADMWLSEGTVVAGRWAGGQVKRQERAKAKVYTVGVQPQAGSKIQ